MLQTSHPMQTHNAELIAIARTQGHGDENSRPGADAGPKPGFL